MKTNEVLENIKARRSVRAYTEQQVPEEDLRTILEAATYAPSGMHLETWHFTAIQNVSKLAELNERIKGAFAKSDDVRLQERARNKAYCCYYHAPTLVIVSNEPTQWWAGMDCACAIENMFLAAQSLGIGSCWINQLGTTCDDPGVREFITEMCIRDRYRSRTPEQDIDTRIGSWNESCIGYPGGIYNNHLRVRRARKCEDG